MDEMRITNRSEVPSSKQHVVTLAVLRDRVNTVRERAGVHHSRLRQMINKLTEGPSERIEKGMGEPSAPLGVLPEIEKEIERIFRFQDESDKFLTILESLLTDGHE